MLTGDPQGGSEPAAAAPSFRVVIALGMAAIWLILAAIIGAIGVAGDDDEDVATAETAGPLTPGEASTTTIGGTGDTTATTGGESGPGTGDTVGGPGGATDGSTDGAGDGGEAPTTTVAGDRTGVSDGEVKYGVHAPLTIGGAPLPLADDPVKGVRGYLQYINERGGINGRKIRLQLEDDRYETRGGATAAARLIEARNFFISGTLGVDQIFVVANEARKAGVPYIAAGGPERIFKNIGMHQIGTSYDTHVIQLARYIKRQADMRSMRIGIMSLDSPYMQPAVDAFEAEADRLGLKVVSHAKVRKPTEQTTYSGLRQQFTSDDVELVIPMQDPITTSRVIVECGQICPWTYTFSNFAHESDTALTLFGGRWGQLGVKGLAGGCYYMSPTAYDPSKCAAMNKAHQQWVAVYGQDDWEENGQGGSSGYQFIYFWVKAMTDAGRDLTRERFLAAMNNYDNYSNLVSSPITFKGSSNYAHGSEKMVVFQAQLNNKYKQLTPGFVEF